jgi:two-component system NtrC family sensor kinase
MARQLAISFERTRLYTETKRAYQDLRNTQEQLLQSEKMSALGRMISGVAHELNNPLTAILGYAQLLEAEALTGQAKDFLGKLYKQVQRTQKIVYNLLSFSRQHKPYKGKIDLAQVLEETLSLREPDLKLNNILVVRSIQPVPAVVADAHQLEQVFLNIINNAADAILENAKGGKLEVGIFEADGCACVEFHDSGPGITDLSRIFEPFYTTKKLGKGTGLGLSICYGIIKEHSGEITASNHLQGGAIFQIRLPLGAGMADRGVQAAATPTSATISAGT